MVAPRYIRFWEGAIESPPEPAPGFPRPGRYRDIDRPGRSIAIGDPGLMGLALRVEAPGSAVRRLVLRPVRADLATASRDLSLPRPGAESGLIAATFCAAAEGREQAAAVFYEEEVRPYLTELGVPTSAAFRVRPAGGSAGAGLCWFSAFTGRGSYREHLAALASNAFWQEKLVPAWEDLLADLPEVWRLMPGL
jgi:hypothetical protein